MTALFDYAPLVPILQRSDNPLLADALDEIAISGLDVTRYGDIPRWQSAVKSLPAIEAREFHANQDRVSVTAQASPSDLLQLKTALAELHPWRKGPFNWFGVDVDTEWRSDFKWNRLSREIESLQGRRVLDVGCGSGYHCWRMLGEGADLVIGIDPTPLFVYQFWAMQRYANIDKVWVVPARLEQLPSPMHAFETVFSMGVLYHRRSPFDHLQELKDTLVAGGELVLETLVIEGGEGKVLVPSGRYSKMGNVWFIPSVPELVVWLEKMKFRDVRVIDVSVTSTEEQRSTDWMRFHSLKDFLDPQDMSKTVEGYPAPRRAIVRATA